MRKGHGSSQPPTDVTHRETQYVPMGVKIRQEWLNRKCLEVNKNMTALDESCVQLDLLQRQDKNFNPKKKGKRANVMGDKKIKSEKHTKSRNKSDVIIIPGENADVPQQKSQISSGPLMASTPRKESRKRSRQTSQRRSHSRKDHPELSLWSSGETKVKKTKKSNLKPKRRQFPRHTILSSRENNEESVLKTQRICGHKRRASRATKCGVSKGKTNSQNKVKRTKSKRNVRNCQELGIKPKLLATTNLKIGVNLMKVREKSISRRPLQRSTLQTTGKSGTNSKEIETPKIRFSIGPRCTSDASNKKTKGDQKRPPNQPPAWRKQISTAKVDTKTSKAAAPLKAVTKKSRASKRANRQVQTTFKEDLDPCYGPRDLMTLVEVSRIRESARSNHRFCKRSPVSSSQAMSPSTGESFSTHSLPSARRTSKMTLDSQQISSASSSPRYNIREEDGPNTNGLRASETPGLLEGLKQRLSLTKCKGELNSSEIGYKNYQPSPGDSVFRPNSLLKTGQQLGVPIGRRSHPYLELLQKLPCLQTGEADSDRKSKDVNKKKKKRARRKRSLSSKGCMRSGCK